MSEVFETTDYGLAAYAQFKCGCVVESLRKDARGKRLGRGRARFVVYLPEDGMTATTINTEFLNSEFYQFDELVRRLKKTTYVQDASVCRKVDKNAVSQV